MTKFQHLVQKSLRETAVLNTVEQLSKNREDNRPNIDNSDSKTSEKQSREYETQITQIKEKLILLRNLENSKK